MFHPAVQSLADRIVKYLAEENPTLGAAHYLALNIEGLYLKLDPAEADLPTEIHKMVLRYWQALPKFEGIPERITVEPEKLQPALGYLMLVDVVGGQTGFRYALYGTKIVDVAGFDMTGQTVWDIKTSEDIRLFFGACYVAALELRRPLFTVHEAPPDITTSHWNRLILPLGEHGEIKRFLVCNVPFHDGASSLG